MGLQDCGNENFLLILFSVCYFFFEISLDYFQTRKVRNNVGVKFNMQEIKLDERCQSLMVVMY